ncbi:hypothetical protein COR16_04265 [Campylobacter upsaliensis]|nr:hypothetical protein [Campylobacter upsaliensis]EAI7390165.1 hypothetical protein [Campylobacter upsaliensis]EAJ5220483.1 hypothetical protein [Campylobacter upsaliensis]EDP6920134.1 hypothetical protein [Campylobacter upsaliensis]EGJ6987981.1 hypothetical protein [Campylobacter upsaliensis]
MKKFLAISLFLGIFALDLFAGTQNTVGLDSAWKNIEMLLKDAYVSKIICLIFVAIGLYRAYAGSMIQFGLMLMFAFISFNLDSIVNTMSSGIF